MDPLRFERRMQPYQDCVFAGYKPGVLPLNYGSRTCGGTSEDRTHTLQIKSLVLCQLSYDSMVGPTELESVTYRL